MNVMMPLNLIKTQRYCLVEVLVDVGDEGGDYSGDSDEGGDNYNGGEIRGSPDSNKKD